ncbi:MAG: Na+/H+-dicarboxylate symporter, partial [Candidatus Marinamargulisbacteria bacterium]
MKLKLHSQVFLGIVLGVLAGILLREQAAIFEPIGDIFIRLLRMVIVPLVFASLVMGVVSL